MDKVLSQRNIEDVKAEFFGFLNETDDVTYENTESTVKIRVSANISSEDLRTFLSNLYVFENELAKLEANNIYLYLKGVNFEALCEAFKFSMQYENLCDPLMLINILNLIKTYNTLNDEFFEDETIYFSSTDDLVDFRLEIGEELENFSQKLSIYFISLLKSYNKVIFSPMDNHITLPKIYKNLFLSTDFMTLCAIFAISKPFSTSECVYIDGALEYLFAFQEKNTMAFGLIEAFLQEKHKDV